MTQRDNRNPEDLGKALAKLRELHPDMSAAQRADILDESYRVSLYTVALTSNGKLDGSVG